RMETTISLSIGNQSATALIDLIGFNQITFGIFTKIIIVDKVSTRIVRRVDVNQLYLPEIGLLQQLQRFQVVAFNEQILGSIKIHTFFKTWAQCFSNRSIGGEQGFALTRPVQVIAFLWTFNNGF